MVGEINFGQLDPVGATKTAFDNTNDMINNFAQKQAGQKLQQGDEAGAESDLLGTGQIDAANALKANAQAIQDAKNKKEAQFIGDAVTAMNNVRQLHGDAAILPAFDHISPLFKLQGLDDNTIATIRQQLATDPDGTLDAFMAHAQKEGFTLGQGQSRYDANGKLVASAPESKTVTVHNADGTDSVYMVNPDASGQGPNTGAKVVGAPNPGAPVGATPAPAAVAPPGVTDPNAPIDPEVVHTIIQESGLHPDGAKAVATVIANRARMGKESLSQVVKDPDQFGYGALASSPEHQAFLATEQKYPPGSPEYIKAEAIARGILTGQEAPVGNYTQYYSPAAMRVLAGKPGHTGSVTPSWDNGSGVDIAGNRFFANPYKGFHPATVGASTPGPAVATTAPTTVDQPHGASDTPGLTLLASGTSAHSHYLTPDEVKQAGYQPGTVVMRDVHGNDDVKQAPPKDATAGPVKLPPDVQATLKDMHKAINDASTLDALAQQYVARQKQYGTTTGDISLVPFGGHSSANGGGTTGIRARTIYDQLFDKDDLSHIQELDAISNKATPLLRPSGSGRILGQEYTAFKRAFPNSQNTDDANAAQAQDIHESASALRAKGAFFDHWAQIHGSLDGVDDAWEAAKNGVAGQMANAGQTTRHRVWSPGKGIE